MIKGKLHESTKQIEPTLRTASSFKTKTEKSKFISVQLSSSLSSALAGFSSGA